MKKFTLLFLATILTFVISSCSKTEEVAPPTVVGVWKVGGLGVITDTKTVDATTDDIKKLDAKAGDAFATQIFEFKADGTATTPTNSGSAKNDAGKYVVSADGKLITITSTTAKDSKGNPSVQTFDIISLTNSELKFGVGKLTKKGTDGQFVIDLLSIDFAVYVYGLYVFTAKGLDADKELKAAKTITATYNLKK
jgi:hypothetical protein